MSLDGLKTKYLTNAAMRHYALKLSRTIHCLFYCPLLIFLHRWIKTKQQ